MDDLASCRVAVIGLGLMGGSFAMGLRNHCAGLLGVDPAPEAQRLAVALDLFDQVASHPKNLLSQADLIVLATPVQVIMDILADLPELHPGRAMVLDLGSTKTEIVQKMELLPERFDPLGGHPMCGKERGGLANADPGIFVGATFALTPLQRSSRRVRWIAEQLSQVLGADPIWLEPQTHDRWVASTSHIPYLVANSLAASTPADASPLIGPGFRSTTRLAPTPWLMMRDILETNHVAIRAGLHEFSKRIRQLEDLLARDDGDALRDFLNEGAESYDRLIGK